MQRASFKAHNKFELALVGPDHTIKQRAYAYNVVLDSFWTGFFGTSYSSAAYGTAIGTGTGTPSSTDTALFTPLTKVNNVQISNLFAYPTSELVAQATFVASPTYVGTITEVGLTALSGAILTHAMLQDAEGNTISIVKTDVDTLIVTSTIYFTIEAEEPLELIPSTRNVILTSLLNTGAWVQTTSWFSGILASQHPFNQQVPALISDILLSTRTQSAATRSFTFSVGREPALSALNNCMVNFLYLQNFGVVELPNEDIFPFYTTAFTSVGTGDGSRTTFPCPIPVFIEDTEEIRVAGSTLIRGTDYTIQADGNSIMNASAAASMKGAIISGIRTPTIGAAPGHTPGQFHPWLYSSIANNNYFYGFRDDAPLVFDLGTPRLCNTLRLSRVFVGAQSIGPVTGTIHLDYSNDNIDWTNIVSIPETSYENYFGAGSAPTNIGTAVPGGPIFTFTDVTARYWRFRFILTAGSWQNPNTVLVAANNGITAPLITSEYASFIGYVGQGIIFDTPPADGASIIIKAQVDRPWKTVDYVIDTSYTLTL